MVSAQMITLYSILGIVLFASGVGLLRSNRLSTMIMSANTSVELFVVRVIIALWVITGTLLFSGGLLIILIMLRVIMWSL